MKRLSKLVLILSVFSLSLLLTNCTPTDKVEVEVTKQDSTEVVADSTKADSAKADSAKVEGKCGEGKCGE